MHPWAFPKYLSVTVLFISNDTDSRKQILVDFSQYCCNIILAMSKKK